MEAETNNQKGKKPGFWVIIAFLLTTSLVGLSAYFTYELIDLSDERQKIKYDLAVMNDVKYGVFDINVWKHHLGEMLKGKIEEFELTSENREAIKAEIERLLYQLVKEINKLFKKEAYSGEHALFKGLMYEIFVDIEDMKRKVPGYAKEIFNELDKPENLKTIKEVLNEKIQDAFVAGYKEGDRAEVDALFTQYECGSIAGCNTVIKKALLKIDQQIKDDFLLVVIPVMLVFFLLFLVDGFSKIKVPILVTSCIVLLAGGILIPMIEIDARIESITFNVLGGSLSFENQILYYQSKSITEVVELLTKTGKWDMIGVGVLILMFSIFFPCLKLLSSMLLPWFPDALRKNPVSRFLIYRSGKWSLADVLVVALFMAYIGFRGVVDNQFNDLQSSLAGPEILTTNHTGLQIGFTLFFCFCIASIMMSLMLTTDYPERIPETDKIA